MSSWNPVFLFLHYYFNEVSFLFKKTVFIENMLLCNEGSNLKSKKKEKKRGVKPPDWLFDRVSCLLKIVESMNQVGEFLGINKNMFCESFIITF